MNKRLTLLLILAGLACSSYVAPAFADYACTSGTNTQPIPYANEQITVSSTSLGLTATKYNPTDGGGNAIQADISTEGSIRIWYDGTAPTAAIGIPLVGSAAAPVYFTVCTATIPKLRMIRQSADSTISVQYSR